MLVHRSGTNATTRNTRHQATHPGHSYLDLLLEPLDPEERELEPLEVEPELRDELLRLELLPLPELFDGLRLGILPGGWLLPYCSQVQAPTY